MGTVHIPAKTATTLRTRNMEIHGAKTKRRKNQEDTQAPTENRTEEMRKKEQEKEDRNKGVTQPQKRINKQKDRPAEENKWEK